MFRLTIQRENDMAKKMKYGAGKKMGYKSTKETPYGKGMGKRPTKKKSIFDS